MAATHGRFIGRVGGLAVALGIGAAIAAASPTAAAEDTPSSAASTGTEASGTEASGTEASSSPSSDSESPARQRKPSRSEVETAGEDRDARASERSDGDADDAGADRLRADEGPDDEDPADDERETPEPADEEPATAVAAATAPTATTSTAATPAKPSDPDRSPAAPVSPLATPQQLEAERIATETVGTWPVRLMKQVLSAGWRATAAREYRQISGPDPENLVTLRRAVDEYALAAAFQQLLLNSMTPTVVAQVAPPHTWYRQSVSGSRILYDNPDTVYRFMGVNMTSTYVIRGRFTDAHPADTNFSVLTGLSGITADNLSGRQIDVGPDGSFTITVSGAAAAPGQRNHLQLTPDSTLVAVRNTLSDWNTQSPMTLSIERLTGPRNSLFSQLGGFAIPGLGPLVTRSPLLTSLVSSIPPMKEPPPFLRGVFTAVIMALGLGQESKYIKVATTDAETGERVPPNVLRDPSRNAEFLATQLQSAGYFHLADDQALVVTITPANARYFIVPVTDLWTVTGDYWHQQTSLNNAQAVPDPDGKYTFVISPTDPGVHNWVSTGGLNKGTVSIRFQDLDLASSQTPTLTSAVVAVSDLDSVLPPTTVFVTPAQRAAQLTERATGFARRFGSPV
ncbi:hypothetical protein KUF57_15620 [Mycolicibacterium sp. PAM1]|uniref:hypothetical protein n=1 Tax=Mycolicibacterium sp. PAM1 TaxID=2853535 RepID=UPI001C3D78C0|nr:hypothetical protein [Mycolicibacterium sp. PAM1]MBV5244970.1 hypothetical protein [Mycolicibacterium sp. PAM1]